MKIRSQIVILGVMILSSYAFSDLFMKFRDSEVDTKLVAMMDLLLEKGNAPYCEDPVRRIWFPSKMDSLGNCDDGDATLFNGLLCSAGIPIACDAVKYSQDTSSGEWLRSPRIMSERYLRPSNSFSPDMALGLQIYSVYVGNDFIRASFHHWLQWIEDNRPCIGGSEPNCIRGLPRFCRDDNEKGCTIRPGDTISLKQTTHYLNIEPPPVLSFTFKGVGGRFIQDELLLLDAKVNQLGYSLHLVGVNIWLARLEGYDSETLHRAAEKLYSRQPQNPFFEYLAKGSSDQLKYRVLNLCPTSQAQIPLNRSQWAWERADSEQAWKQSMLWDCVFIVRLLLNR
jgi:hypothetical protein